MRKKLLAGIVLLILAVTALFPYGANNAAAQTTPPSAYYPADCVKAGQSTTYTGPAGCINTLYQDRGSVDLQSWNPTHDYETFGGEVLGMMYDTPVVYKGTAACSDFTCLAPGSDIFSVDVANGTYYQFTIIPGVHAYRLNGSNPVDLGALTPADYVYSVERYIGMCEPDGSAQVDGAFLWNATAWFNTCLANPGNSTNQAFLLQHFNYWLNSIPAPVGVCGTNCWFERVDAAGSTTTPLTPYLPWLGNLVNSWTAVYPKEAVINICGDFMKALATSCSYWDGTAVGIGSGPYLLDETKTDLSAGHIYLTLNPNYCQVTRANGDCNAVTNSFGGPSQHTRIQNIAFKAVVTESTRRAELLAGIADEATLSPTNLVYFLNASTTPVFNALNSDMYFNNVSGVVPDINFWAYSTAVIQHVGLLYAASATSTYYAENHHNSPLWGSCSPITSGCLVRRGIVAAVDYINDVKNTYKGLGTQIAGFVPNGLRGNSTAAIAAGYLPGLPTQNLALANSSFEAAGYSSAHPLSLTCAYNIENVARKLWCDSLALVLATRISDTGGAYVTVGEYGTTFGVYVTKAFVDSTWDITSLGWFPDYFDQDNYARAYADPVVGTFMVPSGYTNSTLHDEVALAAATPNGPARDAMYFDMQRTLEQNALFVWRVQPSARTVLLHDITGFALRGVNPAFLSYELDLTKVPIRSFVCCTPCCPPPITTGTLTAPYLLIMATSLVATVFIYKIATRKIRPG